MKEHNTAMSPQRMAIDLQRARNELQTEHERVEKLLNKVEELQAELDRVQNSATRERDSRLQAEEALGETRDRLQLALEASNLATWDWTLTSPQVFLSARWGEMLEAGVVDGYWDLAELRQLVHPDDLAQVKHVFDGLLTGRHHRATTQFRIKKMGQWLWIESHGMVVDRDDNGHPLRLMGTHADISERKRVEEESQNARRLAEQASQAKSDFLANISHEVRTPLNALMGLIGLLLDTPLQAEQRKWLELMDESANALLSLLNDVLDLSRIEAGKLQIEHVPYNMADMLREVARLYTPQVQAKNITLHTKLDRALPTDLMGDPARLRQILVNLLSNAVKFTPAGGQIDLSVQANPNTSPSTRTLLIQVKDTGIGIAKDRQAAIFDAFTQEDGSTARHYGGSGLGLSICSRLAHLMGGNIKVVSESGQGSTFSVQLPLTPQPSANGVAHLTAAATPVAEPTDKRFVGLRVLVAEDHPVNELLLRKLLSRTGCDVVWAHDGEEAVTRWQAGSIDLVLMDVQMPGTDGLQATRRIRAMERQQLQRPRTPIIAITANAMNGDELTCLEAGMDAYTSKPIRLPQLLQTMEQVLHGRSTPAQQATTAPTPPREPSITPVEQLLKDLDMDPENQRNFLQSIERDLPTRLQNLATALEHQDSALAMAQAHLLKGSLDLLQADRSARFARGLEMAARTGEWSLYAKVLPLLQAEVRALQNAVTDYARTLGQTPPREARHH